MTLRKCMTALIASCHIITAYLVMPCPTPFRRICTYTHTQAYIHTSIYTDIHTHIKGIHTTRCLGERSGGSVEFDRPRLPPWQHRRSGVYAHIAHYDAVTHHHDM